MGERTPASFSGALAELRLPPGRFEPTISELELRLRHSLLSYLGSRFGQSCPLRTKSSPSATVLAMESTQRVSRRSKDAVAEAEAVRVNRLREDARRPMSVNLAETIALSHALLKMADAAQRR